MASHFLFTLLAFALVLLNGFFVAAEFAIVKLRQTQAAELARTHGLAGKVLFTVRSHLDAYLSACQLGITLASLGLGWIGEPAFARLIEPLLLASGVDSPGVLHGISFAVAFSIISFLHIVLGELAPKSVSIRKPEAVSLWTALPLYTFHWIMYPFIWVLNGSANLLLRWIGVELAQEGEDAHSISEIKQVLLASHRHGELEPFSANLLTRAIQLNELTAGDVMRPASDMAALDARASLEENLAVIDRRRYSRYPVYDGDPDNVIGVVHVKDLFAALRSAEGLHDLRPFIKRALVVDELTPAARVLEKFRKGDPHLAIVIDEYGNVEGFVTLDDILEALIGSIRDEFEHGRPGWTKLSDGTYTGQGSLPLYSLERLLGAEIAAEGVNSIGGLIMTRLDRIPREGDVVPFPGFTVEVLEMRGARIAKVLVRPGNRDDLPHGGGG
ncbi:MAG TPA: hemolysin family protein [Gammaproteobacteria bacterium]|nr:hemolysin family protein [Gammaproteobacteria bacterium]